MKILGLLNHTPTRAASPDHDPSKVSWCFVGSAGAGLLPRGIQHEPHCELVKTDTVTGNRGGTEPPFPSHRLCRRPGEDRHGCDFRGTNVPGDSFPRQLLPGSPVSSARSLPGSLNRGSRHPLCKLRPSCYALRVGVSPCVTVPRRGGMHNPLISNDLGFSGD